MTNSQFLVGTNLKMPSFDEARRDQYKRFWQERGFSFILTDPNMQLARRGSFFNTFFSMNPKHLETKLTGTWQNQELECVMEVNLTLQQVTEWHKAFLELEMITFESFMQYDDRKTTLWRDFVEDLKNADAKYTWSCGIFGRKMPDDKKKRYLGR